jgi:AcrR family transcriptional regulator
VSRAYRSSLRAEQAAATKRLILDAARRVFRERGYAGTTIAAVAEAADVAVPTVYASVGGKPAIVVELNELITQESAVPAAIQAIRTSPDPVEVVRLAVDVVRRIHEEFGDVIDVLRQAAPTEPDAAAGLADGLRRHRMGFDLTAHRLEELGALRKGMTPEQASEILGVLTMWGTWEAMVQHYGWSWDAAADWVVEVARATILRDP